MPVLVFLNGSLICDLGSDRAPYTSPGPVLVVDDDRVLALGERATGAVDLADPDVRIVDLAGGVLAPALADGHAHLPQGGLEWLGPQIRAARSVADIVAAVGAWADEHPEQEWIYGASYDATLAAGGLFDARWLDEVCPDRPVVLQAWDYHTVWVNSEALRRAGIDADTPEPELGRIVRREDGSPLGILQEPGAVDLVSAVAPGRSHEEVVEAIRRATRHYAGLGLGWAQDAWVEHDDLEAYLDAARRGLLAIRVNLAQRADPRGWRDQLDSFAEGRDRVRALGHPLLTADTVKVFVDGIVENHTAAMLAEYADRPGDRGLPNWTRADLLETAIAFDALGFQLHFHAIGDAANRLALDVFETVQERNGPRDRRPVIAHAHVLDPSDVPRFAALGVVPDFQPLWARCDGVMRDLTMPHLGEERSRWQYAIRSVLDAGAAVSFGSDWPVTGADWRAGAATAVARRTPGRPEEDSWLPEQRIGLAEALAAYTTGVAHQAFAEGRRGVLAQGYDADLVWLDADPRQADPDSLVDVQVLGTWVAGRERFRQ
ncbi:amidohydrolase [Nocardioides sp. BP30]|uniref:amidohydrolase n=1 Tax=Nocardioides sp. BP30 TaxID=3036374 RepID=UPI0024684C59|nr:amidohydrolase [Nocardioides sp. BP30]WGL51664.1 amidohydrolase [Nocardioides sp. BP30]